MEALSGSLLDTNFHENEVIAMLKDLNFELVELENSPNLSSSESAKFKQIIINLVKLLETNNHQVHLLAGCCFVDILRIVAPNEIMNKKQIKAFLHAIIEGFSFLNNPESKSYPQVLHILEVLADTSCLILAIKSGNSKHLVDFIAVCLKNVSESCGHTCEMRIADNIRIILEELKEITENFIIPILESLKKSLKGTVRYRISFNVLGRLNLQCRGFISTYVKGLFIGKKTAKAQSALKSDQFFITYKLYQINHEYILSLLCEISEILDHKPQPELVEMIGKIAYCKKSSLYTSNSHLFQKYLNFFENESDEIRIKVVSQISKFCKNHVKNEELVKKMVKAGILRLRDSNEKIRRSAISQVCKSTAFVDIGEKHLDRVCERLRDVKPSVRKVTAEELFQIYKSKCIKKMHSFSESNSEYSYIIENIFQAFAMLQTEEQVFIVNLLEDLFIDDNFNAEQHANILKGLFNDLSDQAKSIFSSILQCKAFWGSHLLSVLSSDSYQPEAIENLCSNMKTPLLNLHIKKNLKIRDGSMLAIISEPTVAANLKMLLSNISRHEKIEGLNEVQKLCSSMEADCLQAFLNLKARCLNFIVSADIIEYVLQEFKLIRIIGKTSPHLILPYLDKIFEFIDSDGAEETIFELLSGFNIKDFDFYQRVEERVKDSLMGENKDKAKSAGKILKQFDSDFVERILKDLLSSQENIYTSLISLKQIMKSWPILVEPHKATLKKLAFAQLESTESDIESKSDAIIFLHSLVKYLGVYREHIFAYIRKTCFKTSKLYSKLFNKPINDVVTSDELIILRMRCAKSMISIIKIPEYKSLLNHKTLAFFAHMALNPSYNSKIAALLLENIYKKSSLVPPFIAILSILAATLTENKECKEALIQVCTRMKLTAEDQTEPDAKLKLQPEAFAPYVLFIVSKCRLPEKVWRNVLQTYIKCLFSSHKSIDVNYLMYLSKQLSKFVAAGKEFASDLWKMPEKNLDLEKVCSEFRMILAEGFLPGEYNEVEVKVLIPSVFFMKKTDPRISSPSRLNENSGIKRKLVQTSPRSKDSKMKIRLP